MVLPWYDITCKPSIEFVSMPVASVLLATWQVSAIYCKLACRQNHNIEACHFRGTTWYVWASHHNHIAGQFNTTRSMCEKNPKIDDLDYVEYPKWNKKACQSRLQSPRRFQAISERQDRSDMPAEVTKAHAQGRYFIHHRGCMVMKSADDLAIVKELFAIVRPATVIELGTYTGGTALWMADTLQLEGVSCSIYSVDIDTSLVEERVKELKPDNVKFLQGDSNEIAETFSNDLLKTMPHPWVVIEDAHVNVIGVLEHFAAHMITGDYIIMEDTNPNMPNRIIGQEKDNLFPEYVPLGTRKLECVKTFLTRNKKEFAVDSYFTDFFGYNGTWNWHGYIRHM